MEKTDAFHSILFPVDFSESSATTAIHVRSFAELTGARVKLLHVIPWLSAWYGQSELRPQVLGDSILQRLEQDSAVTLETFREKYFSGIQSSHEVKSGGVSETIIETAEDEGSDLIMMPTRGCGPSRPFLIGSTTAKVLHDASCAVWTSPHRTAPVSSSSYRHIVCALDREHIPLGYLKEAIRLSSCFQSRLTFVTAASVHVDTSIEEHRIDSLVQDFPDALLRQVNAPADCNVLSASGPVGDVVKKAVEMLNADLVLANRGHLAQPFGKFRTHTYEIVLESPCPVISLCIHSSVDKELQPAIAHGNTQLIGQTS